MAPPIRSEELDRRIEVRRLVKTKAGNGQEVLSDGDTVTITWAKRIEQRLSEVFSAGSDQPAGTVVFRIRWRSDISSVSQIVVTGGQRFEIKAVQEYGRRLGLDLICERLGSNV